MKRDRHKRIMQLIQDHEVETQEELVQLLIDSGLPVTQATISRDIKQLNLVKALGSRGQYKYTAIQDEYQTPLSHIVKLNKEMIHTIQEVGPIICIETFPGMAKLIAREIKSIKFHEIAGIIGDEDTIFILVKEAEHIEDILQRIQNLFQ